MKYALIVGKRPPNDFGLIKSLRDMFGFDLCIASRCFKNKEYPLTLAVGLSKEEADICRDIFVRHGVEISIVESTIEDLMVVINLKIKPRFYLSDLFVKRRA